MESNLFFFGEKHVVKKKLSLLHSDLHKKNYVIKLNNTTQSYIS